MGELWSNPADQSIKLQVIVRNCLLCVSSFGGTLDPPNAAPYGAFCSRLTANACEFDLYEPGNPNPDHGDIEVLTHYYFEIDLFVPRDALRIAATVLKSFKVLSRPVPTFSSISQFPNPPPLPPAPPSPPTNASDVERAFKAAGIPVVDSFLGDPATETWLYLTNTYGQVVTVDTFSSRADIQQAVALDRANQSGDRYAPYLVDVVFDQTNLLVRVSAALPASLRSQVLSVLNRLPNAKVAFQPTLSGNQ